MNARATHAAPRRIVVPWFDRCRADLGCLDSSQPGLALLDTASQWLADPSWNDAVQASEISDRHAMLGELAAWMCTDNVGGYAQFVSELMRQAGVAPQAWLRAELVREHMAEWFFGLADVVAFREITEQRAAFDKVVLEETDFLDAALAARRGVMILAVTQAHPAFAFCHPRFANIGISAVANLSEGRDTERSPLLESLAERIELLPVSAAAVRPLLARLRSGEVVTVYADFRFPRSLGIRVPLFGRPVFLARSAIAIALATGAAVLPVSLTRRGTTVGAEIQVRFFPPLPLADLVDSGRDDGILAHAALRFALAVEALIRFDPAAWRLWGTLPYRWQEAHSI